MNPARDLWDRLPAAAQDWALLALLLAPALLLGGALMRGYRPAPLIRALLWRYRGVGAVYAGLIALAVGMGVGLTAQERGLRQGMARAADKFDLVVAAPGSELTMLLASVFLRPDAVPLLDGAAWAEIVADDRVALAAPLAFGDSYGAAPVVGTTAQFVTHLSAGRITGRLWADRAEAVTGAAVPLEIGARFIPAHGIGDAADPEAHAQALPPALAPEPGQGAHDDHDDHDTHDEHNDHDAQGGQDRAGQDGGGLIVVGRMAPTGTPWDRAILVPVETVWGMHGLADGHAPAAAGRLGPPFDAEYFPGTPAVILRADPPFAAYALKSAFTREDMMAFFPGTVLAELYRVMGDLRRAMSLMALVAQVLVAVAALAGLVLLARLFRRQLALLRALGAPRRFILAVVWGHAGAVLAAGAALGLGVGIAAAAILSRLVSARTGVLISAPPGWDEVHLVAGFLGAALLVALIPACAWLRQPPAPGLRA